MRKKWKRNKLILPLLLSAIMIVEPVAVATTVYAEESEETIIVADVEQTEDTDVVETPGDDMEQNDQNTGDMGDSDFGQNDSRDNSDIPASDVEEDEDPTHDDTDYEGEGSEDSSDVEEEPDSEVDGAEESSDEEEGPEEDAKDEALGGFAGMPDDYCLTSAQKEEKRILEDHIDNLNEEDEGILYVKGEIMTFADSQEDAEMIAEAYNAEIKSFENGLLVMKLREETTVATAIRAAASSRTLLPAVWPNYYRYAHVEDVIEIEEAEYEVTNAADVAEVEAEDASLMETYESVIQAYSDPDLAPTSSHYQWQHVTVGSAYAWADGYTGTGIKVAVLDSGVSSHEDLTISQNYNFVTGESVTTDGAGHGTHVAGIIGAKSNTKGGVGIAPSATLYNIRVLDAEGIGTDADIIKGLDQAIKLEVDIVNMSLGGVAYNDLFQRKVTDAYNAGIAIFASAGNDGVSITNYPAGYKNVICVAATDTNNGRADFSTYGSWVDISAPGVNIWSTYNGGTSSYASMSGTSMACPVASGEAAVLLSSHSSLKNMGRSSKRVDDLLKLMKSNSVKASGSGMGSGITSLTKAFKLSTAATKPNTPTITAELSADKQSVKITITAQAGMKLCYTTNGKNPVWKNETPDANTTLVETNTVTIPIDCSKTAKGTVKAFAINSSGVISAVKSLNYTLKPYVTNIEISGSKRIEQGKSVQLAAAVTPSYATNKKVTWELYKGTKKIDAKEDANYAKEVGVSISTGGKVTAAKTAQPGKYTVKVTAQDDGKCEATPYTIEVVASGAAIQSLAFDKTINKELWITKSNARPTLTLANGLIAYKKNEGGKLAVIPSTELDDQVTWTSSKPAVATVDASGKVTAVAAGTTTITAKANDSGNKKATINITVKQAVTDLTITNDKGATSDIFSLAAGKSMTLKTVVNPAKPTNKKVVWSIDSNDPNISINASSGKITVKAGAEIKKDGVYTVTATAADGKGVFKTQKVKIYSGAIGGIKLNASKATLYTKASGDKSNTATITATITGATGADHFDPDAYTVTSSNESVVKVSGKRSNNEVTITLTAAGGMYGKANVVIASTDGSNKKATCAVTVSGGITKAELRDADGKKCSNLTLFRDGTAVSAPKTAILNVALEGSVGANLNAYDVTSSNPSLVSVTLDRSSNKITLKTSNQSTGKATITLASTDGSKKKATCTVTVVNPVSKVHIASNTITASYKGIDMCVVQGKNIQLKATLESEYGKVSNTGVTWTITPPAGATGLKISSSGKVSADKKASVLDSNSKPYVWTVTATAKDGSGAKATYKVWAVPAATVVSVPKLIVPKGYVAAFNPLTDVNNIHQFYQLLIYEDVVGGYVEVSSSNKQIVEVAVTTDSNGYRYLLISPRKVGAATITLKATDGSGKKVSYKVMVTNKKLN